MKDMLGNKVKTGNLMMEFNNYQVWRKPHELELWKVPDQRDDGMGICYTGSGERIEYLHVHPENSLIIDKKKLPKGFLYSFKHGMQYLKTSSSEEGQEQIIANSNWKEKIVTKEMVAKAVACGEEDKLMRSLNIKTHDDFIKNIDIIKSFKEVTYQFMCSVLLANGDRRMFREDTRENRDDVYDAYLKIMEKYKEQS